MDNRRPVEFMAALFVALGYHVQMRIRAVCDLLELRFAEFSGAPYLSPLSRQQWEELWETDAEFQQLGTSGVARHPSKKACGRFTILFAGKVL